MKRPPCSAASPGTRVKRTGESSFSRSFLPVAGHSVSPLGFTALLAASGARLGTQKAFSARACST